MWTSASCSLLSRSGSKVECALQVRRGPIGPIVEDEEPAELGRDFGDVIVRILALEIG